MVTDLDNGLVLPQVPYNCFPTGIDRGQDVLNLPVPGNNANVFSRLKEQKRVTVRNLALGKTKHRHFVVVDTDYTPANHSEEKVADGDKGNKNETIQWGKNNYT